MFKSLQVGYQLIHKEIMPWVEAQVVKKEDSWTRGWEVESCYFTPDGHFS